MYMEIKHILQGRMSNLQWREWQTFFNAKKQRIKQSEGTPSMEEHDEVQTRASSGFQK